jgi:hypothetical protein
MASADLDVALHVWARMPLGANAYAFHVVEPNLPPAVKAIDEVGLAAQIAAAPTANR